MTGILGTLLWISLRSCIVIASVMLLRMLFRRAPKWTRLLLWGLAALSLLLPIKIESPVSLMPREVVNGVDRVLPAESASMIGDAEAAAENELTEIQDSAVTNPKGAGDTENLLTGSTKKQLLPALLITLWLFGAAAMLLYALGSYLRLRKQTAASIAVDGVYYCDDISSPFVLGLIRPRIFLPSDIGDEARDYVLAHEKAHIRAAHQIWKALGYGLLSLFWFHPLVWAAWYLFDRDLEMACDERVIRELQLDQNGRADYSETLLALSMKRSGLIPCPLSFSENDVKSRVKEVLNYRRAPFWIILSVLVLGAAAAVVFLTVPRGGKESCGRLPLASEEIRLGMSEEELRVVLGEPTDTEAAAEKLEATHGDSLYYFDQVDTIFGKASAAEFRFTSVPVLLTDGDGNETVAYVRGLYQVYLTFDEHSGLKQAEKELQKFYGKWDDRPEYTAVKDLIKSMDEKDWTDDVKDMMEHETAYQYCYDSWKLENVPEVDRVRIRETLEKAFEDRNWPEEQAQKKLEAYSDDSQQVLFYMDGWDDRNGLHVNIEAPAWNLLHADPAKATEE